MKSIISSLWIYCGLPPSKLSSFCYAFALVSYLTHGGYCPKGRSQAISNALTKFIEDHGGTVKLNSQVKEIVTKNRAATGVRMENGDTYFARVVISNASAHDTFQTLMHEPEILSNYLQKLDQYSVSLSSFQIFLGLKKDIIGKTGITDTEIFHNTGYDPEADYEAMRSARVEDGGYALALYDNLYRGYSPEGKNTLNITTLQGYDHWQKYEADYINGRKEVYQNEKRRMADILIERVEKTLLPGLRDAIEVIEIGTPLTNVRYTRNYRGAIYGWDQTIDNSGNTRLPHATPVKNLYLAGAWTKPGHGYVSVILSGLECFGEIMKEW